jgi:pimeloyl-ACP methyl ester carboxylesterase
MHYVLGGNGPPVVIVHGGLDSWWAWREVMAELAGTYTVILPAIRGFARSSKPSSGYDLNNVADDVHTLVTRHLGFDRFAVAGNDWGGNVGYFLAAQFRDVVSRLAIFETVLPGVPVMEEFLAPKPGGDWLWFFALCTVPHMAEMLLRNSLPEFMQTFISSISADPDAVGEESVAHYVNLYSQAGALTAFCKYYENYWVHAEQCREHMRTKLQMPVIAYGGDAACGERTLESVRPVADDVRGGIIPDCGHWVAEENPQFVVSTLRSFLAEGDHETRSRPGH